MSRKKISLILFVLALILIVGATATYIIKKRAVAIQKDEAARTLFNSDSNAAKYIDTDGKDVSIDHLKGSIIVVNIWASWSPYAVTELPILDKLAKEFKDKGVEILAINRKENYEQAQRFLNTQPAFSNLKIIIDVNDSYYKAIEGFAMPETVIYDKDGVIINHLRGLIVEDDLRAELTELTK